MNKQQADEFLMRFEKEALQKYIDESHDVIEDTAHEDLIANVWCAARHFYLTEWLREAWGALLKGEEQVRRERNG